MVWTRRLGHGTSRRVFTFVSALLLIALVATGCATTQPAATIPGHEDPIIWRPIKPHYPMPD